MCTVLPFLGEFPKSGVSGGKLGKEFGPLGIPQHAQILPQSWGILMKIGERKLEINPLLHVKFGQHFVVYAEFTLCVFCVLKSLFRTEIDEISGQQR